MSQTKPTRKNTQEDLDQQQSFIDDGIKEVENQQLFEKIPQKTQSITSKENEYLSNQGYSHSASQSTNNIKSNLQVSIYKKQKSDLSNDEQFDYNGDYEIDQEDKYNRDNNFTIDLNKQKSPQQESQNLQNNFFENDRNDNRSIGKSNNMVKYTEESYDDNLQSNNKLNYHSTKLEKKSSETNKILIKPQINQSQSAYGSRCNSPRNYGIQVINSENINSQQKEKILQIVDKCTSIHSELQTVLQNIVKELNIQFGSAWGVSLVNKELPSFFEKKYEYLLLDNNQNTYEIFRLRIDSDDKSQKEIKTLIKTKEVDNELEEQVFNIIKESCNQTDEKEERSKIIQENLDNFLGKFWLVTILDHDTSIKYNYAHNHIRMRIQYQNLFYEIYKNVELQPENNREEGFKIISRAENITDKMIDTCLQFLREAYQETQCKFSNMRSNILKKKLENEYGVYWTVIICHKGSAFFNYFDKEHVKILFRGLQYDMFRSNHMFDALHIEDLSVLQKDKLMDKQSEEFILNLVQDATQRYSKPDQWNLRGGYIRNKIEEKLGQYWAVIISKAAIKNYSYFKNQFIRIRYKRVIYDIYRSSVQPKSHYQNKSQY